ncbi:hypothetical protein [Paraburkholderia sp. GAS32]|jgi:hypothetical protein
MAGMQHAFALRHGVNNVKFEDGKCFVRGQSRNGQTVWHFMGLLES